MSYQIAFLIFYIIKLELILSITIKSDNYIKEDSPYRDDIEESTTEVYHHIITSEACYNYIDYYKGIFYKEKMPCYWHWDDNGQLVADRNYGIIEKYLELGNINSTNLKELHHYGCTQGEQPLNILVDYYRFASDSIIQIRIRFTNTQDEDVVFDFGFCESQNYRGSGSDKECLQVTPLDNATVPNNSFIIYTFRFDNTGYYKQKDNFTIKYLRDFEKEKNKHMLFYIFPQDEKKLYMNSYIISVDILRYVLAITGHAHNYCNNQGCIPGTSCNYGKDGAFAHIHKCRDYHYARYYEYTDCSLFGCIPGSYCNDDNTCIECDHQCRTCKGGYMNCVSCYSISILPQWFYYRQFREVRPCIFEFYPINKIESYNIDVPIPLAYRLTFEFWIYIHDPIHLTNKDLRYSLSSIILKDFFTFSFHVDRDENDIGTDNNSTNPNVTFLLTPFEFFFPFKKDYITKDDFYNKYLELYPALQYLVVNIENSTSRWVYVKGGLSYTHKKIFINDEEKDLQPIPIYTNDEITTYNYLMRKFYRRYEKTILKIQGFSYLNTDIYIRNLNFYSDYLFNKANSPNYFDIHNISNNILKYPQLMFSIPFTNISVESVKLQVKYKMFDFSGQYNDLNNEMLEVDLQSKLIRDTLAPSKNFYRLNFLEPNNSEFSITDLGKQDAPIECSNTNHQSYCFEDNHAFICNQGYNLLVDYFDNSTECSTSCVKDCILKDDNNTDHKYMRLPNIKRNQTSHNKIKNDICTYECDLNSVDNCPYQYSNDIKDFKCKEGFYSFFYQCLNESEYISKESAFQFSGTLNSKSIYFPFHEDLYTFYIEVWFHTDLLTQEEPPLYSKFIFMTNNHQIYYDVTKQQFMLKVYGENGIISTFNLLQKIYYFGWNHLILYVKEEEKKSVFTTTFIVSLANNLIEVGSIQGRSPANQICFCNTDRNCCGKVSNALWFDLFIREIKVWDPKYVNYYTMNDYEKFSYIVPGGLLHYYNLTAASMDQNIIIDLRNPDNSLYNAIFPYEDEDINPDNDINFNIGWNFNWNDINYPKYIVSTKLLKEKTRVEIFETSECNKGCLKCFGYNKFNCFSCQPGYALIGSTCTRTTDDLSIFYYINPLKKEDKTYPDLELELDFQSLHLDNYATITLFFYIKIYGFTQEQIDDYKNTGNSLFKLITLSEEKDFILYYNMSSDTVLLKLGTKIQYQYSNVITKFGYWIPISISAFRSEELDFRKNFVSMTFDDTLLPYLGFENDLYERFPFETFKISKYLIAHFADITLYDLFIINGYGYAQHKYLENGKFSETSDISRNRIIIKSFSLFYIANHTNYENITNECVNVEDIINTSGANDDDTVFTRIRCKEDYLPYNDQKCKDDEFVELTTSTLPPGCVISASKCENIVQVTKNMLANCDYLYASCDTKSTNSINNLIYTYSPKNKPEDKYIVCGNSNGLDLARFEPAIIPNITSPTDEFKIEFWFLSQSYVDNHFKSMSVEWKDHIKIEVFFNSVTHKFGARCIPMNDEGNMMEFEYNEANNDQNRWRYIVCGVDALNNKAYMTNLQKENRVEKSFIPNAILNDELTTLNVSENSRTNYGVTYLKELRLWKCYDCSSDRAFVAYSRDDPYFSNVIHYFKFDSPSGFLQDYHTGYPEEDVYVQFITKTDFSGYGLLNPISETPNCNEGGQMYFSIKMGEGCDTMFNFNIFKKDVIFEDIPSSRTNSYTIEFWFYVESADNFTQGMNLIYEDHMTISALAHEITDTNLDVYCFPQGYRDLLENNFGENMKKRYDEAENKAKYTYIDGFSKWNYVRCSYSYDLLKYYINDEDLIDIKPEIFFNGYENDKPFKMFMNNLSKLKINISKDNYVRIIIQTINIYRDYIPKNIQTKYTKMNQYILDKSNNPYYAILFSVNFPENYDVITDKLKYYVTDYDITPEKEALTNFLGDIEEKSYKTYPLYDPFKLCNYGQVYNETSLTCRTIMQPNNCDKSKTFCIDILKFFWCPKGHYLDINELKCNTNCPVGYTRPPDIIDGYGMCYIKASDKHYASYPYENKDLKKGVYETKFSCEEGYTLINYNCIPNEKIETSGLYFSSKYKFSNLIASYNKLDVPITNYYIDFWFLFDITEEYRFNIPNDKTRYTIFIAYPHFITRFKGKIQYNDAYNALDYYDIIDVEDIKHKWNHVVLENYQIDGITAVDTFKYINIFWNNNYLNPLLSLKLNNRNSYALSQIAFCHENNGDYSICNLGLNAITYKVYNPYWDDAYYKDIKVWNRNSSDLSSINTFGSPLNNKITMNIISYHPLTVDTIKNGYIQSLVTFMEKNVDFIFKYNLDKVGDNSTQINWVTDYDITFPDKYIYDIDVSKYTDKINSPYFSRTDTTLDTRQCEGNCYKCFTGSEEDCISCKNDYLISGTKCVPVNGYYFKVPTKNQHLYDNITISEDLSSYEEITIMFFMKFLGSISQRIGIVPILYFYEDQNYLGWDIEKESFIINILGETIFDYDKSRLYIGKWSFFSISIYFSNYAMKFPNMIQFMIDENIIQPTIEIQNLNKKTFNINKIRINNKMSAVFYDLRLYNKFFIGSYGIGINSFSSTYIESLLINRYLLKSTTLASNDCLQNEEIGSNLECVGDYNPYNDPNLICETDGYKIIDSLNNQIECGVCENYCNLNFCTSNTTKNCTCVNDDLYYWIKYNFNEEKQKFYCEKIDSINLNEYNDIIISNIGIGGKAGYMIEFWIYIQSYIDNDNFGGLIINWEHFLKIHISYFEKDLLKIDCYPYSDNNDEYIQDKSQKFNIWVFYRCQVDKDKKKVINPKSSKDIKNLHLYSGTDTSTTLTIKDLSDSPFGVILLRELRLYNDRNTNYEETSHLNLDKTKYISLIHYFKCNFTDIPYPRDNFYDSVTEERHNLDYKYPNYPYSYISPNYTELILCEEGFDYKKNIEGKYECVEVNQDDLINRLGQDDNVYLIEDLLNKIENVYETTLGDFVYTGTNETNSDINIGEDGKINLKDPPISDSYCSLKGMVQIVQRSLACYCIGEWVGKYCQIKSSEFSNLERMYELFLTKAQKSFIQYISPIINQKSEDEYKFLKSLNSLIEGNQLYAKDASFATELTSWLHSEVIFLVDHCDLEYIKLVDNIFTTMILITNTYKAGLISNNKGTKRNADLNYGKEEEIDINVSLIKKELEYLTSLCFTDTVDGLWSYKSDNIHVDLFKIPKNGNINIDDLIKSLKENKYQPYFQLGDCLDSIKSLDGENINIQFITWIFSPYYHHNTLNYNYTSNYIEIKLYNDNREEIQLEQCKDNTKITFYLTLTNPELIDIINNNRFHFQEGNIYKSDDGIFTEPKYILEDGSVSEMSLEERREKYYFEYLLIYKTMEESKKELLSDNLISFDNLENTSYFRCSSNHLSEFLLTYEYNPKPDKILGRFYFLNHIKLFLNINNLKGNYGFYTIIVIVIIYFINFSIVKLCLFIKKKRLGNKNYLLIEDFLNDYVYPYGNIEGDFFVNKNNLNKIYNNNLNTKEKNKKINEIEKKSKDLLKIKEKLKNNKIATENILGTENEKNDRKNAYLNEENFMNFGDLKNKKLFQAYYREINLEGYNSDTIDNQKSDQTLREKTNNNENDNISSSRKIKDNIKDKKNIKKKDNKKSNNYIASKDNDNDNDNDEFDEEEVKEVNEFNKRNKIKIQELVHSLQISNENIRIRILSKMKVNVCTFFCTNIKNRIIFLNTFKGSYTYSASIKALCFPLYLLILFFVNTFIFICLKDESDFQVYINSNIGDFIWRCLVPVAIVNIYFYLTRFFYNLSNGDVRYLLFEFKTNKKSFDKHYMEYLKKIRNIMIVETILFFILVILSYIFSFGLFAVYPAQGKSMFVSLIIGIIIDLLLNLFAELFIAILFVCRKNHVLVVLLDYLNRLISYKMLSP